MEEQAMKNLYTQYLEQALEIEYRKVFRKKETPELYSPQCLCDKDGNALTGYFKSITEHENGNYFIARSIDNEHINHYVFFNRDGQIINTLDNVLIEEFFYNKVAIIRKGNNHNIKGYINYKGELLGNIEWGYYSESKYTRLTKVESTKKEEKDKYGYIDENGTLVIPCQFSLAYTFSNGYAFVRKDDEYFFIDETGKKVLDADPSYGKFSENLVTYQEGTKKGVKNSKGEIVVKPTYDYIEPFENGLAKATKRVFRKSYTFYIDHQGNRVNTDSLKHGMPYIKTLTKMKFYNKFTDTYDTIEYIPYQDLDTHLLCVEPNTQELYLYNKQTKNYIKTNQKYDEESNVRYFPINDFLQIGTSLFYKSNQEYIDITSNIDITKIISYKPTSGILEYESFATKIKKDPNFYNQIVHDTQKLKQEEIQGEIKKRGEEADEKRQAIIEELERLKGLLSQLDQTAGKRSNIDEKLLLMPVGNHLEVKPEFVGQLKYLDLAYINFANVKVSNLDFSGSNASINPQEVYQKDMSNGNYNGLNFATRDFNGVNVKGSKFNDCNMDFTTKEGMITDETTEFSEPGLKM